LKPISIGPAIPANEFAQALMERVRAGVKVHLMLDWLGSEKMTPQLLAQMSGAGVEIERYHALHWYSLGKLNNRTHRKVLIVDGKSASPAASASPMSGAGMPRIRIIGATCTFEIEGPVVAQFQAAFLDNWIKTTGRVLNGEDLLPRAGRQSANLKMHMFMSSPAGRQRKHATDVSHGDYRGGAVDRYRGRVLYPR
jgi:cardiolipin synthase